MSSSRVLMGGCRIDLAEISDIEAGYSMTRGLAACGMGLLATFVSCMIGPVASAVAALVSFAVIAGELFIARRRGEQIRILYRAGREEHIACLSPKHAVETRDHLLQLKANSSR